MYKRIGAVALPLAIAALAWVVLRSPVGAPRAFDDLCRDDQLATLNVGVTPARFTYTIGDVARFKVQVIRAIKTDEHEQGQEVGPAGGAEVRMGLTIGAVILSAEGTTDDTGLVRLKVHLPSNTPKGTADIVAFAEREIADVDCVPHEAGHFDAEDFIRIRR